MRNRLKPNKMYVGYNFNDIKSNFKCLLSPLEATINDYGKVIEIECKKYSIYIDSILHLDIIKDDNFENDSIKKNIYDIENIINNEVKGFKFENIN